MEKQSCVAEVDLEKDKIVAEMPVESKETVCDKDAERDQRGAAVADKNARLGARDDTIDDKDAQLAARDDAIADMAQRFAQMEQTIVGLKQTIAEKDDSLAKMSQTVAELTQTIVELRSPISTKDLANTLPQENCAKVEHSVYRKIDFEDKDGDAKADEASHIARDNSNDVSVVKVADEIPEANEENVGLSKGLKGHVVLDTGSALNRHSDGKDLDATPEVKIDDQKSTIDHKSNVTDDVYRGIDPYVYLSTIDETEETKEGCMEYTQVDFSEESLEPKQTASDSRERKIATEIYDELCPTKEITPKVNIERSFPEMDAFEGGIHRLASGNSGLTFKSMFRGVPVVFKVSRKKSDKANRSDYHEWSISDRLKPHPNVLHVVGLCPSFSLQGYDGVGSTAIITPLQANGGLCQFLDKSCNIKDEYQMANVAFGMIQGIRSLHEQRVIHRDIALRNFLVDEDGRILLCDFGLAQFLPANEDHIDRRNERLPWRWIAPESHKGVFSKKSDIWMYGQTLFEVVKSTVPWPSYSEPSVLRHLLFSEIFKGWSSTNIFTQAIGYVGLHQITAATVFVVL